MAEPSIDKVLARLPITAFTVGEVAAQIGKSTSTVRRWRQTGLVVPTIALYQGEARIPLYTESDVERAKAAVQSVRRGPKPKLRVAGRD